MSKKDLSELMEFARKLHGHVGPCLVLGLRMGLAVKNALCINGPETAQLEAAVYMPLHPPTSCLLDGIQVSTTCTIGNQRLQFGNSESIHAFFSSHKNAKAAKITLTESLIDQLKQRTQQDKLGEQYAWELAELPETKLFNVILE